MPTVRKRTDSIAANPGLATSLTWGVTPVKSRNGKLKPHARMKLMLCMGKARHIETKKEE